MTEAIHEVPGPDGGAPDWRGLAEAALESRTPTELVSDLAARGTRFPAYFALDKLGSDALPAIRAGLKHDVWEVRRWSAALLDHHADDDALYELIPLLDDPMSKVRLWAVHSLSCDRCKVGENPVDVVPHLLRRLEIDPSIKVRRMAAAMLGEECTLDERVVRAFERILAEEKDRKLRFHATRGLERYRRERA